jgi:hypothetical protein
MNSTVGVSGSISFTATMFLVAAFVVRRLTAGRRHEPFGHRAVRRGLRRHAREPAPDGWVIVILAAAGRGVLSVRAGHVRGRTHRTHGAARGDARAAGLRPLARAQTRGLRPHQEVRARPPWTPRARRADTSARCLIMMACSVAIGGIVERSEVMRLVPESLGSTVRHDGAAGDCILVIVGMTMDPYGAVILVSASFAQVAYRNGIQPGALLDDRARGVRARVPDAAGGAESAPGQAGGRRRRVGSGARSRAMTFWQRNESVIVPCAIMGVALLVVAFVPLGLLLIHGASR